MSCWDLHLPFETLWGPFDFFIILILVVGVPSSFTQRENSWKTTLPIVPGQSTPSGEPSSTKQKAMRFKVAQT